MRVFEGMKMVRMWGGDRVRCVRMRGGDRVGCVTDQGHRMQQISLPQTETRMCSKLPPVSL